MEENLKKMNAVAGKMIFDMNREDMDEESQEFLDQFMATKVKDIPELIRNLVEEAWKEMPEELMNSTVKEFFDMYLSYKFDE